MKRGQKGGHLEPGALLQLLQSRALDNSGRATLQKDASRPVYSGHMSVSCLRVYLTLLDAKLYRHFTKDEKQLQTKANLPC